MERRSNLFQTDGSSALAPDYSSLPPAQIIDINRYRQSKKESQAFNPEFYEKSSNQQITDDLTSYLGEYRFNVPDFKYIIGINNGRLVDPNTGEDMEDKAQKSIEEREKNGLGITREVAEKEGLASIVVQLSQNPTGTIVWFSPPGQKEDGYGEYGFGFVGKVNGDVLEMTAIRLENPQISDFNKASKALWGKEYHSPEDFLRTPKVINQEQELIEEFIHGNFEIRDQKTKEIFSSSLSKLKGAINHTARIIKTGTEREIKSAINTLENLALEVKGKYESSFDAKIVFLADFKVPDFAIAMNTQRYQAPPPPVLGSCGMSGKTETSNILGKLLSPFGNGLYDKSDQEWFSCPKCKYKASGPVGNTCPGCRLTKEEFVENGGEEC